MVAVKDTQVIEIDSNDEVRKSILEAQGYTFHDEVPQSVEDLKVQREQESVKQEAINEIKASCTAYDSVTLIVGGQDITFNGGDSSASAISGAVELANSLGETTVGIWDINNKVHTLSIVDAFEVAKQIALKYRTDMYNRQNQITALLEG
jgi:hypothetical protein